MYISLVTVLLCTLCQFFTHSWSLVFLIERMEKEKVKKVKHKMGSLFRRRKQSTRQDAKNGEDKKADPLRKEMVESDKDYLPDEIHAEEQNADSLEENSQAKLG